MTWIVSAPSTIGNRVISDIESNKFRQGIQEATKLNQMICP